MASTTGFTDSNSYAAAVWARVLKGVFPTGCVLANIDNANAVSAGPGIGVTIATGISIALGYWRHEDSAIVQALATADGTNPRIDYVIFKVDITGAPSMTFTKKDGTPAGSPVAPSLTQTSTVWEVPLATVLVPAGATLSNQLTVTDARPLWPCVANEGVGSTVGSAGGASALVTPVEYWTVRREDGVLRKIAVFNV